MAERSRQTPKVRCSNRFIVGIFIQKHLFTVNCIETTKIKKKEAVNGPFKITLCIGLGESNGLIKYFLAKNVFYIKKCSFWSFYWLVHIHILTGTQQTAHTPLKYNNFSQAIPRNASAKVEHLMQLFEFVFLTCSFKWLFFLKGKHSNLSNAPYLYAIKNLPRYNYLGLIYEWP